MGLEHRRHALLKELISIQFRVFGPSAPLSRGRSADAQPFCEPPCKAEKQPGDAQDIRPGSQIESQKYGGHIVLPESLLCKKLKSSSTDEKQETDTATNPSHPLERAVPPSLAIHKITTV